jgi:hypothetical protein
MHCLIYCFKCEIFITSALRRKYMHNVYKLTAAYNAAFILSLTLSIFLLFFFLFFFLYACFACVFLFKEKRKREREKKKKKKKELRNFVKINKILKK